VPPHPLGPCDGLCPMRRGESDAPPPWRQCGIREWIPVTVEAAYTQRTKGSSPSRPARPAPDDSLSEAR